MRHRLGLATRTQISVCKLPFPSARTAVSLFRAKTVQQRPLLPREVETRVDVDKANLRLCKMVPWATGQNTQLISPYNSNVHKPNFTKRGCHGSLDIVVYQLFQFSQHSSSFLRSAPLKTAEMNFSLKNGRFELQTLEDRFSREYHH